MTWKPTTIPTKILKTSITSAATTFQVNNILGWNGLALTSGDFGTQAFAVFRNAARTQIELFEFNPTTIASTNITIVRRGLQFDGNVTTEVAGNKFSWTKSDTYVDLGTDTPQLFQLLKEYIDGIAISGSPDSSDTVKGLVERATVVEIDAGTADGSGSTTAPLAVTAARLAGSKYSSQLPSVAEKAAMAGGGALGTPSGSNKFLTQEFFSARTIRYQYDLAGSPFTWTKQTGLKYVIVEAWGGGGAGGSGTVSTSGGGGGGYTKKRIEALALGATETVTVGGSATNSTFGALVTGYRGGNGGGRSGGGSGIGGGGGGGVLGIGGDGGNAQNGGAGLPGFPTAGFCPFDTSIQPFTIQKGGIDGGGAGAGSVSGNFAGGSLNGGAGGGSDGNTAGGVSAYGGNGGTGSAGTGSAGVAPGGGGGGGNTQGGAGGAGRIIVTEYYS